MQPTKARMTFRFDGTAPGRTASEAKPPVQASAASAASAANDGAFDNRSARLAAPRPAGTAAAEPIAPAVPSKDDRQAWTSPYQDDIQALEEMIRGADRAPVSGFSKRTEAGEGIRSARTTATAPAPVVPDRPRLRETSSASTAKQPKPEAPRHAAVYPKPTLSEPPESRLYPAFPGANRRSAREEKYDDERRNGREEEIFSDRRFDWEEEIRPIRESGREEEIYGDHRKSREGERYKSRPNVREQDPYAEEPLEGDEAYEGPEILEHGWVSGERYGRSDGPSWLRVFVTVIGAIATGGLFGYLLLTLFTGQSMFPKVDPGAALPAAANPSGEAGTAPSSSSGSVIPLENGSAAKDQTAQGSAQQGASGQAAVVPGLSLYVLQYGVFQSEASMNEAAQQLRDKGIAAATDTTDGGFRVYAGISPTKSAADALVASLAGTEVYVKALDSEDLKLSGTQRSAAYASYLKASSALLGKIAGFAAAELSGGSPSAGNDIQSIRTAHQVWLEQSKAANGWDAAAKQAAQDEIEQLGTAVTALNDYSETPSNKQLWNAQAAAMNAALADLRLRAAMQGSK